MTPCLSGRAATRALRTRFQQILPHFDERRRRLYLASEAMTLGHGGIVRVAAASGTYQVVLETIAATITKTGLTIGAGAGPGRATGASPPAR